MRGRLALAAILCLFSTLPTVSFAQTGVGVGTGVGVARSTSQSGAVAIGGGNANSNSRATGGSGSASATANGSNGNSNSSLTINSAAQPAATSQSVNTTGMQTLKTVPNAYSPGLSAAGLETCLGSISGGGSAVGWGASFGTTIPDPGCNARLDARTLWSIGLKAAAIARLCQSVDIYNSMPDICTRYRPGQPAAYQAYASLNPGQIELIEGKTGLTRMCDNYDASRARCLAWTGAAKPHHKPKRTSPVHVASAKSAATAVEPVAAPTVTDPPLPQ